MSNWPFNASGGNFELLAGSGGTVALGKVLVQILGPNATMTFNQMTWTGTYGWNYLKITQIPQPYTPLNYITA